MRFYEEYSCGCVSALAAKKRLPGYCAQHGTDARATYRQDGAPADGQTFERKRETLKKAAEVRR